MSTPPASSPSSPLLRILLPLAAGIATGDFFYPHLALSTNLLFLFTLLVGLSTASLLFFRRTPPAVLTTVGITLTTFLLGLTLLHHDRSRLNFPDERQPRIHFAVVSDAPYVSSGQWYAKCRLVAPDADEGRLIELSLSDSTLRSPSPLPTGRLQVGAHLLIHTRITSPTDARNPGEPDRAAYLRRQGISGSAHCYTGDWQLSHLPVELTLREQLLVARAHLVAQYHEHLDRHTAALLSAMTLGDRTALDRSTRQLYSESGAGHLLALSGLHLAILYSLYNLFVNLPARRAGRRWFLLSTLLSLVGIWLFALLAGLPISLIRAALMFSLSAVISLFRRDGHGLHSLLLTLLLLLLFFPQWLFDLGFQLSCLAVGGILLIAPLLPPPPALTPLTPRGAELARRSPDSRSMRLLKNALRAVWNLLVVSFAAQLATTPLVCHVFCRLPWSGIFSSLLVIPLAYVLLSGSFLFLLLVPLRTLLAPLLTATLSGLERTLSLFSQGLFAPLQLHPSLLTTLSAYLLLSTALFVVYRRDQLRLPVRRWLPLLPLVLLGVSTLIDDYRHHRPADRLIVYHTYSCTAIHLLPTDGPSFLLCTDTARARIALRSTALHDWEARGLHPLFLPLSALRDTTGCALLSRRTQRSAFAPGVLLHHGRRIAVVDHSLSHAYPAAPLPVDLLLVTRQVHRPPTHLFRYYRPDTLLLSADLSPYYRRLYTHYARCHHLPLYDIAERGFFQLE